MTEAETLAQATEALAGIALPGGGTLGSSGRLSGPVMAGGRLSAALAVSPDEAAAMEPVRAAAEAALRTIDPRAMVALTADRPAPPFLRAPAPAPEKPPILPGVRHVILVSSAKGGVGKSTTCVNLALGLRAMGLSVGILDADVHGPSLPTLLGLTARPRMGADRRLLPVEAHGLRAMSMGLMVDPETAMVWRGPMVTSAITQMLAEVDWGRLDALVVDMPPGTGDAQLAIAQGARPSGAVIVSTPQDLALIDARRGVAMFRKIEVPILGVVENMAHFLCPDCGNRHAIFGTGGAEAEAARLGVPYLGAVPLTMELREASDAGRPVTARDPEGTLGRLYRRMAEALWQNLNAPRVAAE